MPIPGPCCCVSCCKLEVATLFTSVTQCEQYPPPADFVLQWDIPDNNGRTEYSPANPVPICWDPSPTGRIAIDFFSVSSVTIDGLVLPRRFLKVTVDCGDYHQGDVAVVSNQQVTAQLPQLGVDCDLDAGDRCVVRVSLIYSEGECSENCSANPPPATGARAVVGSVDPFDYCNPDNLPWLTTCPGLQTWLHLYEGAQWCTDGFTVGGIFEWWAPTCYMASDPGGPPNDCYRIDIQRVDLYADYAPGIVYPAPNTYFATGPRSGAWPVPHIGGCETGHGSNCWLTLVPVWSEWTLCAESTFDNCLWEETCGCPIQTSPIIPTGTPPPGS